MEEDLKQEIEAAVKVLKEGGVILYPTDTVWGIGCDAADKDAVARVFEIKEREDAKSLITLVADADMIGRYVKVIPQMAIELIEVNDKPMTIIYPGAMGLAENVVAEDGSAGIRVPQSEFCRQLCRRFGGAIVSTSANISGEEAPASFEDINAAILDAVDHIVDPFYEEGATGVSSQIIKVGLDGEIKVIRE
ncbi:MAG: threonylcarbamoyl-AMP synthase [Bacteroidales bacterium]|nr:threonylcarbamoyl-AMP synthase [Bacteroidales bacterium]MBO7487507.1 threonylcarbamoyl-AMP synthase [Bacteroidales bacterium]